MPFDAKNYSIGDILNKVVFDIPRNQRRYVWKQENWKDLYEDILFSISQKEPHFIGNIVLEKGDKQDGLAYYTIIDGQQRLITITLFLLAIMKIFYEEGMDDDFKGTFSYLKSTNNKNQDIIILKSNYHVSLENLIKGILSLKESERNISIKPFVDTHLLSKSRDKILGDAIEYFYYEIKNDIKDKNKTERLIAIRDSILDMTVVKIESSSEDVYTIFEILNARGQELTSGELLKNYIMRYIKPQNRRDEAKDKWEMMEQTLGTAMNKFIKHYATHRFGDTKNKYGSPYKAIQKATKGDDIGQLLDDIVLKSEYYKKIISPAAGEEGNCTKEEEIIFSFFRKNRFEQFRPILLGLIHQRELGKIDNNKYNSTLQYIYNFFVCYTIIGEEKSNKLEDVVYKYAPLLEEDYSDELLEQFCNNLKKKIPGYDWFLNAFKNVGWSDHFDLYKDKKSKNKVQIILEVVEKYSSKRNDIGIFTIEHILPDSQGIENSQIGNLIPLEENLNKSCGDKDLSEKCKIYSNSSFKSARYISNFCEKNGTFSPDSRTKYLAKLIYNNILKMDTSDFS